MKKFLVTIMAILSTFCILSLCACDKDKPFAPHEHTYTETVVEPTCTESGYTLHKCSCGNEYTDNETEVLGHNFVDGICSVCGLEEETPADPIEEHTHEYTETVFESTCTEKGYTLYVCACGYEYSGDEIEAIGHKPLEAVEENKIEATCLEDGVYDSVIYCSVCGEELSREEKTLEALGHNFDSKIIIEPTCLNIGYKLYFCTRCDANYYEELAQIEHDYVIDKDSITELEEDKIEFSATCSVCGDTNVFVAEKIETVLPTCMEQGYDVYSFSYIANNDDEEIIKQFNLNYVEPTYEHLVGYLEDGSELKLYAYGTEKYVIDEDIQYFIDNNKIRFNGGVVPAEPGEEGLAIFECEHCHNYIVGLFGIEDIENAE